MYILGINSAYHESSAALLKNGELVCFIEEERLNRVKRGKKSSVNNPHQLPELAIKKCLELAGISFSDIDFFAYSFSQNGRLQNIGKDLRVVDSLWGSKSGENRFHELLLSVPDVLSKLAKEDISNKFRWVDHHMSHAASAFFCSEFEESTILIVDGIGEINTVSAFKGIKNNITELFSIPYPHSLGFLWEKFCKFLGFSEHDACKLMGLSSYGNPEKFANEFSKIITFDSTGKFELDSKNLSFRYEDYTALEKIFGPSRMPGEELLERHMDIAAGLQRFTEKALLALCKGLLEMSTSKNLCMAGGTALNCVANALIQRDSGFRKVFIQPAANDAGTALGAALYVWCVLEGGERKFEQIHAYHGPSYDEDRIVDVIERAGLRYEKINMPAESAAKAISEGKIVGWFQGQMEMGPRALGNRSLLADPRRKDMREILNKKIKHREEFRPFAPSVLSENVNEWFEVFGDSQSSDFMLLAYPCKKEKASQIPAVVHVDNTSRIQTVSNKTNPLYHKLISSFYELTGVPMVLNTSFNDSEPIVMSPEDAINTFLKTGIDILFIENFVVRK